MFIILIHWRIKPDAEKVNAFKKHWRENVPINDDNGLVGEYLSETLPEEVVDYPIDPASPADDKPYVSFVNVGIWRDERAFYEQVGKYIPVKGTMLEFEQYPRRRIPLEPVFWRRGKYQLPTENNLRDESSTSRITQ